MGAALKCSQDQPAISIDDLAETHPAELLTTIKERSTDPLVVAICDKLKADFLQLEITAGRGNRRPMSEVARLGQQTVSRIAREVRADWEQYIQFNMGLAARDGRFLSRPEMRGLVLRRIKECDHKGKNGELIKRSTVAKWLTLAQERKIRDDAAAHLALVQQQAR